MKVKSESEFSQSSLTLHDLWTAAYQALPSMGFSKQENWSEKKKKHWSGLPLPSMLIAIGVQINV